MKAATSTKKDGAKSEFLEAIAPLRTILREFWAVSRWTLALLALLMAVSSIAGVSAPYVFSRLIDGLTARTWIETAAYAFTAYAVLVGLSRALQGIVNQLSSMCSENLGLVVGTSFFERLVRKQIGFFIENNPAEVQSARSRGQSALNIVMSMGLSLLIPGLTQISLALLLLGAAISPTVVAIVLIYGIAFIALTILTNRLCRPHIDAAIAASQENAKFIGNALNGMETLRQLGADRWMSERFAVNARGSVDNWRRVHLRRAAHAGVTGVALAAQLAITFVILLPQYRSGALTVGDIVLFNALLLQLNQPFEMIGHVIDAFVRSYANLLPFARMWSAPEEPEPARRSNLTLSAGTLRFEEVGYAYDGMRGIEHVSFEARRGQITYVIGATGAGKSTVFRLALKSLEPQSGRITIDGIDLAHIARADWYARIGIVPQDPMLLNETLATNIVLGRPRDEQRLRRAAEKAAILDFIEALPDGFETTVGERGLKLSGGERQRIAIARALYAEPEVLFLDEASSALDEATERKIMDHVRSLAGEVTVMAITHRTGVIRPADAVVRLTAGHVEGDVLASAP